MTPPASRCPFCNFALVPNAASCPNCGHVFSVAPKAGETPATRPPSSSSAGLPSPVPPGSPTRPGGWNVSGDESAFYPSVAPPPVAGASGVSSPSQPQIASYAAGPSLPALPKRRFRVTHLLLGLIALLLLFAVVEMGIIISRPAGATTGSIGPSGGSTTLPAQTGTPARYPTPSRTPLPTATATPLPPGLILYQENWPADQNEWSTSKQWKFIGDGTLGSDGSADGSTGNTFTLWYLKQMPTTDYKVEATIQFARSTDPQGHGYYEFGLMLRGNGRGSGYEVGVGYQAFVEGQLFTTCQSASNDAFITKIGNDSKPGTPCGAYTLPNELSGTSYTVDTNVHKFRAEVKGNSIALFIDDKPIANTTDNTYANAGQVGIRDVFGDINVLSFVVTSL